VADVAGRPKDSSALHPKTSLGGETSIEKTSYLTLTFSLWIMRIYGLTRSPAKSYAIVLFLKRWGTKNTSARFGRLGRNNVETGGASFATTLGHSRKGKAFRSGHLITLSVPWKRAQNAKNEGFAGRTVSFLQNGYKNTLRKPDALNFLAFCVLPAVLTSTDRRIKLSINSYKYVRSFKGDI